MGIDSANVESRDRASAESMIASVVGGGDVAEITKTVMTAKLPIPMGIARSQRRKPAAIPMDAVKPSRRSKKKKKTTEGAPSDQAIQTKTPGGGTYSALSALHSQPRGTRSDPVNPWEKKLRRRLHQRGRPAECLLSEAAQYLAEREASPRMIMYHGTSTKFLGKILKQGLIPNPTMRVWQDDKNAATNTGQSTRASLDGVYFTANFMTAVSSGGNASRKFGGSYLYVAALLQPRAAFADEDDITTSFSSLIKSVTKYRESWITLHTSNGWAQRGKELAVLMRDKLVNGNGLFKLGDRGKKIPIDVKGATDYFRGSLEQEAAKSYAIGGDAWLKEHMWEASPSGEYSSYTATPAQVKMIIRLRRQIPSLRDAERRYLRGLDSLTRRYKDLAKPGSDDFAWFSHTLRMNDPVAYRGRNKIVAVFQVYEDRPNSYVIVHYGKVTPTMIASMKRSSAISYDVTILTSKEARKQGIMDKIRVHAPR